EDVSRKPRARSSGAIFQLRSSSMTSRSDGLCGCEDSGYVVLVSDRIANLVVRKAILLTENLPPVLVLCNLGNIESREAVAANHWLARVAIGVNLHVATRVPKRRPAAHSQRLAHELEIEKRFSDDRVLDVVDGIDVEVVTFSNHDEL